MARLPKIGGDNGNWGEILNTFLEVAHNEDGTLKNYFYNVKDYGATGDGTTDDLQSITKTIDAATNGGVIFFPPGTYVISDTLQITTNNISLVGSGAGATTLKAKAGSETITMVLVGNGSDTLAHTSITNILFTSANQKTGNQAIKLQKCFKTWLENIRIEKQYNAIHVYNSTETWLQNADIRDTKNDGLILEASVGNGYDTYVNNVVADNPDVTNIGNGINWLGSENFVIQNCDFIRFTTGFNINPLAGNQCRFGFFTDAEFDTASDNCVKITDTNGGDAVALTFTNTWTGTANNYGVLVEKPGSGTVTGIRFIGHKSLHNGLAGFRLVGGSDIYLMGCDVVGNSQTSSNNRSGIEIASGIGDNWSIIGCKSGNGWQQGNTQSFGISIDGSHTYTNVIITDNQLSSNTNGSLNLNGATLNGIVQNNIGYTTANGGTATITNGNTTVAVDHNLAYTPSLGELSVTPTTNLTSATKFWIGSITSSQFVISVDQNPGANVTFAWNARKL